VGGASLNYMEFSGIVEAAYRQQHQAQDKDPTKASHAARS
jgi:hypothetical protein